MNTFSKRSRDNLSQVDARLVILAYEVLKELDFTVTEGFRGIYRQQQLFKEGKSQIDGVTKKGKHNYLPSKAIDIMPYEKGLNPFDGSKKSDELFNQLGAKFKEVATRLGIQITWGGDWKSFVDKPHIELKD
jgi:peptidoglycan LD-endopeptidase CwlK